MPTFFWVLLLQQQSRVVKTEPGWPIKMKMLTTMPCVGKVCHLWSWVWTGEMVRAVGLQAGLSSGVYRARGQFQSLALSGHAPYSSRKLSSASEDWQRTDMDARVWLLQCQQTFECSEWIASLSSLGVQWSSGLLSLTGQEASSLEFTLEDIKSFSNCIRCSTLCIYFLSSHLITRSIILDFLRNVVRRKNRIYLAQAGMGWNPNSATYKLCDLGMIA